MNNNNLNVLITGAKGFIGQHVASFFSKKGWTVTGLGKGNWKEEEWKACGMKRWISSEVNASSLLKYAEQPFAIIHCAGGSSVSGSIIEPLIDYNNTVGSLINVFEYIKSYSPKTRLIFLSSAGVYGNVKNLPILETSPLNPISPYGLHKKKAEDICLYYSKNFNLSAAIIRLFSIYGEGLKKQLIWDACQKIKKNDLVFCGTGSEVRDWLHVTDAVRLIYKALKFSSEKCPIVNGGFGIGVENIHLLNQLLIYFNCSSHLIFTGLNRSGDPQSYIADIEGAKNWGWSPKISWQEGILKYVKWFLKESCDSSRIYI